MDMPTDKWIQLGVLGFIGVQFLVEVFLLLQERIKLNRSTVVPFELRHILTQEQFEQQRSEALTANWLNMLRSLRSNVMQLISAKLYAVVWSYPAQYLPQIGINIHSEILRSVVAMLLFNTVKTVAVIPLVIYSVLIDRRSGFGSLMISSLKGVVHFVGRQLFLIPMVAGHVWAFRRVSSYALLAVWALSVVVLFVIRKRVNQSDDHNYQPLTDKKLTQTLLSLSLRANFPVRKISVADRRTSRSKGIVHLAPLFNSQRIVLSPTLLPDANRFTADETAALCGIELAHWKLNHHRNVLLFTELKQLLKAVAVGSLLHYQPIYSAFGFEDDQPVYMGMQLIQKLLLRPLWSAHRVGRRSLIRGVMFSADAFAARHGYGATLQTALGKLDASGGHWSDHSTEDTKSHAPSLFERIAALNEKEKMD